MKNEWLGNRITKHQSLAYQGKNRGKFVISASDGLKMLRSNRGDRDPVPHFCGMIPLKDLARSSHWRGISVKFLFSRSCVDILHAAGKTSWTCRAFISSLQLSAILYVSWRIMRAK